tara:strand:+ start:319 stop:1149 length:831 start_codon:yes stop_codon:yes gene_type:complete
MKIQSDISFIGSGAMANAIIGGLINKGVHPKYISASDKEKEKCNILEKKYGIQVSTSNTEIAENAEIIIFAVKPNSLKEVASSVKRIINKNDSLIISIVAGVEIETINDWLGGNRKIIRCMPNTSTLINHGVTGMYAPKNIPLEKVEIAENILSTVGSVHRIQNENLLDSITAISGSGPAYFFLFLEILKSTAEELDIDSKLAESLVIDTAYGAIKMAQKKEMSITELKKNVTSKGGTTECALNVFKDKNLKYIMQEAVKAAYQKSQDIAKEYRKK